jgi:comEA protein
MMTNRSVVLWRIGAVLVALGAVLAITLPSTPETPYRTANDEIAAWLATVADKPAPQAPQERPKTSALLSINEATVQQWEGLPGIGPSKAKAIVAHREAHGPFRTVRDLLAVRGIGEATLEKIAPLLTIP